MSESRDLLAGILEAAEQIGVEVGFLESFLRVKYHHSAVGADVDDAVWGLIDGVEAKFVARQSVDGGECLKTFFLVGIVHELVLRGEPKVAVSVGGHALHRAFQPGLVEECERVAPGVVFAYPVFAAEVDVVLRIFRRRIAWLVCYLVDFMIVVF